MLTEIPPPVYGLINLGGLHLSDNLITSIPPEIGNLVNLEVLNLDNNRINILPPEISKLTNLRSLNLKQNKLTALPSQLADIFETKLKYVNISYNIIIVDGKVLEPHDVDRYLNHIKKRNKYLVYMARALQCPVPVLWAMSVHYPSFRYNPLYSEFKALSYPL